MQTLLPPERFEHVVNLEPIEVGNSPNEDITSAIDPSKPHENCSTLSKEIIEANRADELCIWICAYLEAPSKRAKPTVYLNSCRISNSLLMKEDCLWVPEEENLWLKLIKEVHDQPAVGHPGTEQILNIICQFYHWSAMRKDIEQYLRNCYVCKQAKLAQDAYNSLFQPLPVPQRPWVDLTMDFVVGLPRSQGYNAILIVVDRLSKEKHYIPCTEKDNKTNAKATAAMFLRYI